MRDVAVIGAGMTPFGELWDQSIRDLFVSAALKAVESAKVDRIDAMYVATMSGSLFVGQEHLGALMADYLGAAPVPSTHVESACASGGAAFRQGFIDVASGMSDIVLVGGVEKMTDGADVTAALATAADQEYEVYSGITFPGLYAMIANAHMKKYGTTREQLGMVAVKNHKNGALNPNAQFRSPVSLDTVLNATLVADPLRLLDCSPVSDGAAAAILCPLSMAKSFTDAFIRVRASAFATDTLALHARKEIARLGAVSRAAQAAYKMAGVTPEQIDFCEVHDCFTIAEIAVIEDLGFCEGGCGGPWTERGWTALNGEKVSVNSSGGLKSKGHPVGATGVAQVIECFEQLTGKAGKRQVKDARIGLAQNMGGSGASCTIHIFEGV